MEVREFVERWTAAWNSHVPERLLELMTEDIVYDDPAAPHTLRGHADVREFLGLTWRAMPDLEFRVADGPFLESGGDRVSLRWSGTATFTGPLVPPGFAPTGQSASFDGFDLYEFREGRVCRLRTVYDMMDFSRQLGLLPPVDSRMVTVTAALQRFGMAVRSRVSARR